MKLNYKTLKPKFNIDLCSPVSYSLKSIIRDFTVDYDIKLNNGKDLQRDFVWTLEQKQEVILSLFKGRSLGVFHVCLYTEDRPGFDRKQILKVVDGKQRLSSILGFINNEFPLTINNVEYYFKDCDVDTQQILMYADLRLTIRYEYFDDLVSDKEFINWFELVNFAGTQQDKYHLNNLKL